MRNLKSFLSDIMVEELEKDAQAALYCPFGELIYEENAYWMLDTIPRFLFNGKELDEESGMYYYSARYYSPPSFISRDPLFEKYPTWSPYNYCANNPVKYIDPTGMVAGDFMDENGVIIGNDGIDDGKLYVLRNEAISTKSLRTTKNFIKENSGNTEAFQNNDIAYKNSTEIEGAESIRQAMYDIVSLDNGTGGTSENNNREHGGYIENGAVHQVPSGAVANPKYDDFATIGLPKGKTTFHSHPAEILLNLLYQKSA